MAFMVVKHLNPIGAMKAFIRPNFNLCMEECLTTLKEIYDKNVTLMNKHFDIYRDSRQKTNSHPFCLITDDTITMWKVFTVQWLFDLRFWRPQQSFLVMKIFWVLQKYLKSNQLWKNKVNHTLCWLWIISFVVL